MKDKKILLVALVALMIVAGLATWFIIQQNGQDSTIGRANTLDQNTDVLSNDGDPLAMTQSGGDDGRIGGDDGGLSDPGKDPNKIPGTTDPDPNAKIDPTKIDRDPVTPLVEPPAEFEPYSYELTIHGKITFKSDSRPAVGAKVTAELAAGTNPWAGWRGDSDGTPKPEAQPATPKPTGSISGSTTTDGVGEYRMTLTATSYRQKREAGDIDERDVLPQVSEQLIIVASMSGYAPAKSRSLWLSAGADEEVNLELAVPAAVRGRIIDAVSREGVPGATGQLTDVDSWRDGGSQPCAFTADEKGYFSLNAIPAGNYVLAVQAKGYAAYDAWRGTGRINLPGGEEKDLGDILLMLAANITGRVIDAETSQPIAGANIELFQPNEWGGWAANNTTTGQDGVFTIAAVDPGTYTIKARATGYAMTELTALAAEPGQSMNVGDIKLGRGLVISGIVTGADDKPVVGAAVSLIEPPGANTWFQTGEEISSSLTDASGHFELVGAYAGTFTLKAGAEGYADHAQTLKVTGAKSDLKISLARGGAVHGRVMDAGGGVVSGAEVRAIRHDSQAYQLYKSQPAMMMMAFGNADAYHATTGDEGVFGLANVSAGVYLLYASKEGETPAIKDDVSVENDREVNVGDLRFAGKGSARITVTEDGAPVPDIKLTLNQGMTWGPGFGHQGTTDNAGSTLIENIPAGTWYIRTGRDEETFDTDNARRRIVIESGRVTEFTLELRPKDGVHLHGKLTINGKAEFNDIMLLGLGNRADVIKTAKPQEGGYYEFIGLKTGTYVLHVRESDKHVSCKAVLELKEEGDFPFDQDFKGFAITGAVTTPGGTPAQLSSVSVSIGHLVNEHADFAIWLRGRANADAEGKFRFENVMPGTYVISASLAGVGTASTQVTLGSSDQGGVSLSIQQNSGSIKLTVTKLNGTPVSGGGFGMLSLTTPDGAPVDLGEFQGWFMLSEGAAQTIPTVEPGTYTLVVKASGYSQKLVAGVVVKKGEVTNAEAELTAAAELHLTVANTEVTQGMLDTAAVRYFDASGSEVARETNAFDSWGSSPEAPSKPTLVAKYLSAQVTEVRVKLAGYAELSVPIQFGVGKKIEFEGSLVAE